MEDCAVQSFYLLRTGKTLECEGCLAYVDGKCRNGDNNDGQAD